MSQLHEKGEGVQCGPWYKPNGRGLQVYQLPFLSVTIFPRYSCDQSPVSSFYHFPLPTLSSSPIYQYYFYLVGNYNLHYCSEIINPSNLLIKLISHSSNNKTSLILIHFGDIVVRTIITWIGLHFTFFGCKCQTICTI